MKENDTALRAEIIDLYNQGYSSKDICSAYNVSVAGVRKVLKEAGFDTRSYRKVSDSVVEKVLLLIKNGYSYNKIEQLLHISTHLVREIVLHNGLTGFAPKFHHPIKLEINKAEIADDIIEELQELYFCGRFGLVECSDIAGASNQEFLWFVYHLKESDKQTHIRRVRENILKMHREGIPATAIAKGMHISPSIVRKVITKN